MLFNPYIKNGFFLDQMYSFEVVNKIDRKQQSFMKFIHKKVLMAQSKCLFKWIKVDKQDYLKKRPHDFKNSFYFGILQVPSMPGMHQQKWLVFWSFKLTSKQCDLTFFGTMAHRRILLQGLWTEGSNITKIAM